MKLILILAFAVSISLVVRNIFILAFSMENYSVHKKRLKQLEFGDSKEDDDLEGIVRKITEPIIKHILPKLTIKNTKAIEKDLRVSGWSKYMNVPQFVSLKIITKVISLVLFLAIMPFSRFLAILWLLPFFAVQFLLNNSAKNNREELMVGFSDFIRITQGYLSSGMPFVQSVEESIIFVSDAWKPVLEKFVIEAEINSIESAIEEMKNDVDIFEVRDFLSLVNLTLEQGGSAAAGFNSQADKIQQMIKHSMLLKINKRKITGILLQLPLLLSVMAIIGLPTVYAFTSLNL